MSSPESVAQFYEVMKEALPQPLQGLKEHIDYTSLEERNVAHFFNSLEYIYDFIDYELLEFIINTFGNEALQIKFQEYKKAVKLFSVETTIFEFITCWEPRFDMTSIPNELITCVTRMSWDSRTTKVEKLSELKKYLSKAIPQERAVAAFYIKEMHSSLVSVTWIVWTNNLLPVLQHLINMKNHGNLINQKNLYHMQLPEHVSFFLMF